MERLLSKSCMSVYVSSIHCITSGECVRVCVRVFCMPLGLHNVLHICTRQYNDRLLSFNTRIHVIILKVIEKPCLSIQRKLSCSSQQNLHKFIMIYYAVSKLQSV